MDKPMIGIRQADGSFYEILGDAQSGHKRLVLSAARTEQRGVRIDLYRSTDGTIDPSGALGSIALDDPQGLGYQDIEFHVDLDADGQLGASAALPGQPPRTLSVDLSRFRASSEVLPSTDFDALDPETMTLDLPDDEPLEDEAPRRSDSDILGDESFAMVDLDTLDDQFADEAPAVDPLEPEEDAPRRSDADILGDDSFAGADLDTLDDFSMDDLEENGTPETRGLDTFDVPDALDLPDDLDSSPASFDLNDLDAGFGDAAPSPTKSVEPAEDWEKISLDDMEPMEFLDTGAEISGPSTKTPSKAKSADDPFRMDDEEPLELGDFDSELGDLPDLGDFGDAPSGDRPPTNSGPSSEDEFDQDFLPPPALTGSSPWESSDSDDELPSAVSSPAKATKPTKAAKATKPARSERSSASSDGDALDKMALILSLAALSLLVLLILVLLFLNMIKAPQPPVIQPEVQRWQDSPSLAVGPRSPEMAVLDLGAAEPATLEAETVLEVPSALKGAHVSLTLEAGDTVEEASRRFGAPAQVQGNKLSW